MDSGRLPAAIEWADLPPELLAIISGSLQKHGEIVRFRSDCRSWRSSTPPLPQKLSPYFPLKASFMGELPRRHHFDYIINANAVYLVRPHSDPTKAWILTVQEPSPGNLILRHALTYQEFTNIADPNSYLLSFTTQIVARSYTHSRFCRRCNGVGLKLKLAFVTESSSNQLVGLCNSNMVPLTDRRFVVRLDLSLSGGEMTNASANQLDPDLTNILNHVNFKGRVFSVNGHGHIFVVDAKEFGLVQIASFEDETLTENYFVVSEGNLYVVSWWKECKIYRLLVDEVGDNGQMLIERVGYIGDRVFFIGMTCSFSISARDLPRPWKGNCVVYGWSPITICRCGRPPSLCRGHDVVHQLGGGQNLRQNISELQGYSELFYPPSFNMDDQLPCQHRVQEGEKP